MTRLIVIVGICILSSCLYCQGNQLSISQGKNEKFPFEMLSHKKKQFLLAINKITVGDSYTKILGFLGIPFDEVAIRGKKIDDPVRGRMCTYYFKKVNKNLVNEKSDEYISFVFDNNRKLIRGYTNVIGLNLPDVIEVIRY